MTAIGFFNALFIILGITIIIEFFKFCLIIVFMEKTSIIEAGKRLINIIKEYICEKIKGK